MHSLFTGLLARHVFAERPPDGFDAGLDPVWAAGVEELVERHRDELAGVVMEPVVQGAGGMRFHSPACVAHMRGLCDEHGLLLVLDEIATGFGRTGAMFASEHADVSADVMCVGKALTGGYMTLAAALCSAEVAEVVSAGEAGGLMHGPTFMANPLACAVARVAGAAGGGARRESRPSRAGCGTGSRGRGLVRVRDVRVLGAIR
jgi:adenosylmethionine-8-amino-7-oxononanoate aminotransferase